MSTKARTRQPSGVPVGGQFAGEANTGTGLALADVTTCRDCGAPTDTAGGTLVHLGEDGAVDHAADSHHLPRQAEPALPSPTGEVRVEADLDPTHRYLVNGLTGAGTSGTVTSASTTPDGTSIIELDLEGAGELVVSHTPQGAGSRVDIAVRVGQSIGRQTFSSTSAMANPDETHLRPAGVRAALTHNLRSQGVTGDLSTEAYFGSRETLVMITHDDRRLYLVRKRGERSFAVGSGAADENQYSYANGHQDLSRLLSREISAEDASAAADALVQDALDHSAMKRLFGWGF